MGGERITLVSNNLNTHTKGAFYEAFPPEQARDYVRRIHFVYTPKHGSWLNVAECELSCMTSQCLSDRRIGDLATLQSEIAAWSTRVNEKQRAVDCQFTLDKARVKLKRLSSKVSPRRGTTVCQSLGIASLLAYFAWAVSAVTFYPIGKICQSCAD